MVPRPPRRGRGTRQQMVRSVIQKAKRSEMSSPYGSEAGRQEGRKGKEARGSVVPPYKRPPM